ncbi:MAG: DUF4348 domain-containing protein [Bacteroidales bacterium]|nr:DUF4348 domain-containing protein [Bacteroidales bacterium]
MNKIMFLAVISIFLTACGNKKTISEPESIVEPMQEQVTREVNEEEPPMDFSAFYREFIRDCDFQKTHIDNSLLILSVDYDKQDERQSDYVYDTLRVESDWECVEESWWNEFNFRIENVSKDLTRVVYTGRDNGIYFEYYFVLKNKEWYLSRIEDKSV